MPSPRLNPKIARLLGLQMFVVILGLVALVAFVFYNTRPNSPGETGGIDAINTTITWIAFIGVGTALAYIHFNFARQLRAEAKGDRKGVKTW
jgi:UDP-N-acetylmuramyl pentapeptide phosphotransferase/UDP-N-acetylglucosamine-1-phosphate transferase